MIWPEWGRILATVTWLDLAIGIGCGVGAAFLVAWVVWLISDDAKKEALPPPYNNSFANEQMVKMLFEKEKKLIFGDRPTTNIHCDEKALYAEDIAKFKAQREAGSSDRFDKYLNPFGVPGVKFDWTEMPPLTDMEAGGLLQTKSVGMGKNRFYGIDFSTDMKGGVSAEDLLVLKSHGMTVGMEGNINPKGGKTRCSELLWKRS